MEIVDIISPNGIEVDIERRMYYEDRYANLTINFQPGLQRLDGKQLLSYSFTFVMIVKMTLDV
ncbi:hypothetical protein KHA80_18165 [Anaerobacillus sp. HL2]|nr:hypothetical protein KHA80_18165 [Anaerobacillus sp. HL2]